MKKIISVTLVCLTVLLALVSCAGNETADENALKIGICNYVDDASLNQIIENIQSRLGEIEKEKNVKFDITVQNCQTDASLLQQIIEEFKADEVDLMVGVATPVAMAMQGATADIPVVFSAVSDPLSVGLADSLDAPGANITGTSDYLDTASIMGLIKTIFPDIKKVGLLYDLAQDSSTTPIKEAKAFLNENGIECIEATGKTMEEVTIAANQLVEDGAEAVFTPCDNSIMASELSIYKIFTDAKIPHITGADSFALNGAFMGYGVDYANLGRETADMVAEILVDGKKPAELPIRTFDNGTATVNTETAEAIGLDYTEIEALIAPKCTKVQPITTAESFQ